MQLDIVFVTYNSEKWIEACFDSISKSDYDLRNLSIIIVDNNSKDNTVELLNQAKEKYKNLYRDFDIILSDKNLGFGKGNNLGFKKGNAPYVFFLNIDTELDKNTLKELKESIEVSKKDTALWELRQFPYEHPKMYNPVSGNTSWSSGAAFVVKREVYEKLGGFDENIFMYAEDVDLSWRFRINGYKLQYTPKAVVYHYSYEQANEIKPNQYFNSIINNIVLRHKFGKMRDILKGYGIFLNLLFHKGPFEHARKQLLTKFFRQHLQLAPFIQWNFKHRNKLRNFEPKFYGWDYEIIREGAFYKNEYPKNTPLVSIIVRTCGRPSVLRETLISLRNQTYKNIEIVVIEDGPNISQEMLEKEFYDLNIVYQATGDKVGRCKAGNIGLDIAAGKYLNFLDDDDVFFADHVEVSVKQLENNPSYRAAYGLAFETPIITESKDPYIYREVYHNLIYKQPFNRILLFHHNYFPIQSVMFEKNIFLEEGGFDENLDILEDWDLWVRYAIKNDFLYIHKVTSMYRVPFDSNLQSERQIQFDKALETVRKKHEQYFSTMNVKNVSHELQQILDSYIVRISSEVFAQMQSRRPLITTILLKAKQIIKRILK